MSYTAALLLWGGATLVFLLVEALTPQLLSVWFAAGSLVALIAAFFGAEFWLQILLWLAVSAAMVFAMRPLSRKFRNTRVEHLNAARIIGRYAVVVQKIDPDAATGQIRVDGAIWSAKPKEEGAVIEEGVRVKISAIEGVRAVVRVSRMQPEEPSDETGE